MSWDPMHDSERDNLTVIATARIKRDLMSLYTEPPPGIFAVGDDQNLKFVYAIIVGPMNTPYEGGFFYFVLKCPNDYPIQPPKVKLLTTDGGKVRFNPNLYKCGKICISILGTWTGPSWSPAQQLASLLITIQSLMNEKPYFNEPGIKKEGSTNASKNYNEIITYQTLRVAVCGMVENDCGLNIPESLHDIVKSSFLAFYDQYLHIVEDKMHLDGTLMRHPFHEEGVYLNYTDIKNRLERIYQKLTSVSPAGDSS